MYYAVDGSLWEQSSPDGYDVLAAELMLQLERAGVSFTLLGKGALRPKGLAAELDWQGVTEKLGDRLLKDGWWRKAVPRDLVQRNVRNWLSWNGHVLPEIERQCVVLKEVGVLLWPHLFRPEEVKRAVAQLVKVAGGMGSVVCFSDQAAVLLKEKHGIAPGRLTVVRGQRGGGVRQMSWEERDVVKERLAGGKEYFLWVGPVEQAFYNWKTVLKAFSLFKKRQRSNMQLVMLTTGAAEAGFEQSLATYKYRGDVQVLPWTEENWGEAVAGAYAVLHTPVYDELGWVAAMSMQSGVPLVGSQYSVAKEWGGDAGVWVDVQQQDSLADALMRLFKDEMYRGKLAAAGPALVEEQSYEKGVLQFGAVLTRLSSQ